MWQTTRFAAFLKYLLICCASASYLSKIYLKFQMKFVAVKNDICMMQALDRA
jgi:hypothetical protein